MGNLGLDTSCSHELITNQKPKLTDQKLTKQLQRRLASKVSIQGKFMRPTGRLPLHPTARTLCIEATVHPPPRLHPLVKQQLLSHGKCISGGENNKSPRGKSLVPIAVQHDTQGRNQWARTQVSRIDPINFQSFVI